MKLINPRIILKILSTILTIETAFFLLCIPVVYIYGESYYPFIWSSLISAFLATVSHILSRNCDITKVSTRDGYLAVTLAWLLISLMGTLPYLFSGSIPSFINAFLNQPQGLQQPDHPFLRMWNRCLFRSSSGGASLTGLAVLAS